MEQKIKQDNEIEIGLNIRAIRKSKGIKQTELVGMLQLADMILLSGLRTFRFGLWTGCLMMITPWLSLFPFL